MQILNILKGGKTAKKYNNLEEKDIDSTIYKEHDSEYLSECIENLESKGIKLEL